MMTLPETLVTTTPDSETLCVLRQGSLVGSLDAASAFPDHVAVPLQSQFVKSLLTKSTKENYRTLETMPEPTTAHGPGAKAGQSSKAKGDGPLMTQSYLLLSGNLMKNGCSRQCPSMSTSQELYWALDAVLKRNEPTDDLLADYAFSSGDENESRSDVPLACLSLEEEKILSQYQCCTSSPPPSPSRLCLPSPAVAIVDNDYLEKIIESERSEIAVSAKIFIRQSAPFNPLYVRQAVDSLCLYLRASFVESAVLSFFDTSSGATPGASCASSLSHALLYWQAMEDLVKDGRVSSIGISNLNEAELSAFLKTAQMKPKVNQIKLPSCHTMPHDLIAFGKQHDIDITTHKDAHVLLEKAAVQTLFEKHSINDAASFEPLWIVRYSFYIKSRGITSSKGYVAYISDQPSC